MHPTLITIKFFHSINSNYQSLDPFILHFVGLYQTSQHDHFECSYDVYPE